MMYGYDGWFGLGTGGWVAMTLMMLAFWGLLGAGLVALVRYAGGGSPSRVAGHRDPLRLLDEELAKGTVSEDEYRRRRELLQAG